MSKLDKKKKLKYDTILNTSYDLFVRKGFSKTSISEITESSHIAKGTFYLYFKDKFDLKDQVIAYKSKKIFRSALNELELQNGLEFKERIIFVTDNIIDQLCNDTNLLKFISKNLSWGILKTDGDPDLSGDVNFTEIFRKIVANSPKKLRDPEIMMYMIVELINSTIYSAVIHNEPAGISILKPYIYSAIRSIIKDHEQPAI